MAAIGGFRSDLSITRKTDENFANFNAGVLFSKVAYRSTKTVAVMICPKGNNEFVSSRSSMFPAAKPRKTLN